MESSSPAGSTHSNTDRSIFRRRRFFVAAATLLAAVGCTGVLRSGALPNTNDRDSLPKAGKPAPPDEARPSKTTRLLQTEHGVIVRVEQQDTKGWVVRTPCGNTTHITAATAIRDVEVVIDPGHGGSESGAAANGIIESELNLSVAREVQSALAKLHIRAVLTRTNDYRVTIAQRTEIANVSGAKVLVSVHHNAGNAGPRATPGSEIYYQHESDQSRRLSGNIWESVFKELQLHDARWTGASDAGAIYRLNEEGGDWYGMLRLSHIPAVLVEPLYISDASQAALISQKSIQRAEGEAIANGIAAYLTTTKPGSGYQTPIARGFEDPGGGGTANGCVDPTL